MEDIKLNPCSHCGKDSARLLMMKEFDNNGQWEAYLQISCWDCDANLGREYCNDRQDLTGSIVKLVNNWNKRT